MKFFRGNLKFQNSPTTAPSGICYLNPPQFENKWISIAINWSPLSYGREVKWLSRCTLWQTVGNKHCWVARWRQVRRMINHPPAPLVAFSQYFLDFVMRISLTSNTNDLSQDGWNLAFGKQVYIWTLKANQWLTHRNFSFYSTQIFNKLASELGNGVEWWKQEFN